MEEHWENIQCSGDSGSKMCLLLGESSGEAKICYFGLEFVVQENVAGLYVSVDDAGLRLLVQVSKSFRDALNDIDPLLPP